MSNYEQVFRESLEDPERFWGKAAAEITWYKRWTSVLDASNPPFYKWFTGGVLNTCYNAVDRHHRGLLERAWCYEGRYGRHPAR